MGIRAFISFFIKWVITWPLLVILGINLENLVSGFGYSDILPKDLRLFNQTMATLYGVITSKAVLYPSLFLSGCVFYEWACNFIIKMEKKNSRFRIFLLKLNANSTSQVFEEKSFLRRVTNVTIALDRMNKNLSAAGLPNVPNSLNEIQEINTIYAEYLALVSKGHFDIARIFMSEFEPYIKEQLAKYQLPDSTEEAKPQ